MDGKYIVDAKAYNKTYGMVSVRKVFKGTKEQAYKDAMGYAYKQAEKAKVKGVDFSVTIKGENWRTASKVNPM